MRVPAAGQWLLPGALLLAGATALAAQQARRNSCIFAVDYIGHRGSQQVIGADTNYYAGGGVRLSCAGTRVKMASDSLISFGRQGQVFFIGHVKYSDSTITMTADRGTYYRDGERWEARGNVVTENLQNGSTLSGPALDYFRAVPGVRDTAEMYAIGRPTIRSVTTDSAGQRGEPYVIVADRVRLKGNDRTWAGGHVTIDRSDFQARSDSLDLDSGSGNLGVLIGSPVMKGLGRDSFDLRGRRIELTLDHREITYVKALGEGHAVSTSVDLVADTIGLDLEARNLVQTIAWGDSTRPRAVTAEYEIRGDSLAFDTPNRLLREMRAFRHAWVGGKPDSTGGDRDWVSGDTVVASFTTWDSAGTTKTALDQLESRGAARSFYRIASRREPGGLPSINYARGERITVRMKTGGQRGVDQVELHGGVDGIHLEPLPPAAPVDSTARPASATGRRR